MHVIRISISYDKYFETLSEMAEFLDIKGKSKKAIASACRRQGYGCDFDDYYGEHNVELAW